MGRLEEEALLLVYSVWETNQGLNDRARAILRLNRRRAQESPTLRGPGPFSCSDYFLDSSAACFCRKARVTPLKAATFS